MFDQTIVSSQETFAIPRVSAVIPTLNEGQNLRWLLPRLPGWLHEIIIVDGHSTDDTLEVVRRLAPGARVVIENRRGKGHALTTGFQAATGDMIVMLDADGSMDPGEIILFVGAMLSGADFVKGSRFIQGAGTVDMTRFRMLGNWGLTALVKILYGGSFSDLCYGYIGFWRKHVAALNSDGEGFEIETLLNIRALQHKLKIVEVASFESHRLHGHSNLRAIPDGFRILKSIVREKFAGTPGVDVAKSF
jgi:glycosyltransferase involved in cell wall biosynthesis